MNKFPSKEKASTKKLANDELIVSSTYLMSLVNRFIILPIGTRL